MAEEIKYIQLRDEGGVKILPKTLGKVVINNAGDNLGTVEAGAQVNKLEKIKVNGVELTVVNKTANVEIPAAAEYGLASGTPEEGFQSTYFLTKDGVELAGSARINVAKDQFLKAGSVKLCKATDEPIEGLKIGDAYIDLELQENDEHIYIPAKDLVNNYLAGTGIIVDANKIAIDETVVATKAFVEDLDSVKSGITSEKVATYEAHIANSDIHVTTEDKAIWSAKQDTLNAEQLKAVNSGITAEKLTELEAFTDGKLGKLTDEQLAAVNSGFTADDKSAMDSHIANAEIHVTTTEKSTWNGKINTVDYESDQIVVDETLESHEDADRELNQLVLFYELVKNGTEEPSDEVTTTVDIPEGATIEFKEIA